MRGKGGHADFGEFNFFSCTSFLHLIEQNNILKASLGYHQRGGV